jgi:hypothetical protein
MPQYLYSSIEIGGEIGRTMLMTNFDMIVVGLLGSSI